MLATGVAGCGGRSGSRSLEEQIELGSIRSGTSKNDIVRYWSPRQVATAGLEDEIEDHAIERLGFDLSAVDWTISPPDDVGFYRPFVFKPRGSRSETISTIESAEVAGSKLEQVDSIDGMLLYQPIDQPYRATIAITPTDLVLSGGSDIVRSNLDIVPEEKQGYTSVTGVQEILDLFSEPTMLRSFRGIDTPMTSGFGYRIDGSSTMCKDRWVYDDETRSQDPEIIRGAFDIADDVSITFSEGVLTASGERPTDEIDLFEAPFIRS